MWGGEDTHEIVFRPLPIIGRSVVVLKGLKVDCGDEWNYVFVNGGLLTEEVIGIKSDRLPVKDSSAEFLCGVGS